MPPQDTDPPSRAASVAALGAAGATAAGAAPAAAAQSHWSTGNRRELPPPSFLPPSSPTAPPRPILPPPTKSDSSLLHHVSLLEDRRPYHPDHLRQSSETPSSRRPPTSPTERIRPRTPPSSGSAYPPRLPSLGDPHRASSSSAAQSRHGLRSPPHSDHPSAQGNARGDPMRMSSILGPSAPPHSASPSVGTGSRAGNGAGGETLPPRPPRQGSPSRQASASTSAGAAETAAANLARRKWSGPIAEEAQAQAAAWRAQQMRHGHVRARSGEGMLGFAPTQAAAMFGPHGSRHVSPLVDTADSKSASSAGQQSLSGRTVSPTTFPPPNKKPKRKRSDAADYRTTAHSAPPPLPSSQSQSGQQGAPYVAYDRYGYAMQVYPSYPASEAGSYGSGPYVQQYSNEPPAQYGQTGPVQAHPLPPLSGSNGRAHSPPPHSNARYSPPPMGGSPYGYASQGQRSQGPLPSQRLQFDHPPSHLNHDEQDAAFAGQQGMHPHVPVPVPSQPQQMYGPPTKGGSGHSRGRSLGAVDGPSQPLHYGTHASPPLQHSQHSVQRSSHPPPLSKREGQLQRAAEQERLEREQLRELERERGRDRERDLEREREKQFRERERQERSYAAQHDGYGAPTQGHLQSGYPLSPSSQAQIPQTHKQAQSAEYDRAYDPYAKQPRSDSAHHGRQQQHAQPLQEQEYGHMHAQSSHSRHAAQYNAAPAPPRTPTPPPPPPPDLAAIYGDPARVRVGADAAVEAGKAASGGEGFGYTAAPGLSVNNVPVWEALERIRAQRRAALAPKKVQERVEGPSASKGPEATEGEKGPVEEKKGEKEQASAATDVKPAPADIVQELYALRQKNTGKAPPAAAAAAADDSAAKDTSPHLGSWIYSPLRSPLLPGELLASNVGATLEVRIAGEWLGPGGDEGAGSDEDATSPRGDADIYSGRWRLGWRGREHLRTKKLEGGAAPPSKRPRVDAKEPSVPQSSRQAREAAIARSHAFWALKPLARRTLWGTDVYTDDSDVLAMAVHAGWVEPPRVLGRDGRAVPAWVPPGRGTRAWLRMGTTDEMEVDEQAEPAPPHRDRAKDLSIMLRVAPTLIAYKGSQRAGIRSRSWGNAHDGVSLYIESVELREPGYAYGPARRTLKPRLQHQASLNLHTTISDPFPAPPRGASALQLALAEHANAVEHPQGSRLEELLSGPQRLVGLAEVAALVLRSNKDGAQEAEGQGEGQRRPFWKVDLEGLKARAH